MNRLNQLTLVLAAVLMAATLSPVRAFDLPNWSVDSGADAATVVATVASGGFPNLVSDASEDGSVLITAWRGATSGQTTATVGWTDGTVTKWSTPALLNVNGARTAYYQTAAISGDGRTVVASWIESTGTDDDIRYAIGDVTIDPSTHVPTVTWGASATFTKTQHQWYPTVDLSYDGTKIVIVYWDLNSSTWNFVAQTATVVVSGTSRTPTFKGPATITTPNWDYTPSKPAMQLKVSRDGTRAIAAWWSSYTPISSGHGRVEASVADIGPSIPFPSSLSGSAWAGRQVLSASNSYATSPPALDFSDNGSKAIVSWQGQAGTGASDLKFAASSIATLTNATTATWSTMVKHYETTSAAYALQNTISADGTRAFVGWGVDAGSLKSGMATAVGSIASDGTPTWAAPITHITNTANYSVSATKMARNGTAAVAMAHDGPRVTAELKVTATNIWSNGSALQTDWSNTFQTLSSTTSQVDAATPPIVHIAKDGSLVTALWVTSTKIWARTVVTNAPTISSVSPNTGDVTGGTTITLTGTGYRPGATVTIGGVACTSPTVVSSTQITCISAAATSGVVDVVVTNVDNHTGTSVNGFSYAAPTTTTTAAPTTTTVAPTPTTTVATSPSSTIAVSGATTTTVASTRSSTTTVVRNSPSTTLAGGGASNTSTNTVEALSPLQNVNGTATTTTNPDFGIVVEEAIVRRLPTKKLSLTSDGTLLDTSVSQGSNIAIDADGFTANEKVLVLLGKTKFSVVASTQSNDSGAISAEFAVPSDVSGEQTLAVYAPGSGNGAQMSITVDEATAKALNSAAADSSDSSGSSVIWWLLGLAGLLVIFWFVIATRSRDDDEK